MTCAEVRQRLLDLQRNRLGPEDAARVRAHLAQCAACSQAAEAERSLTDMLEHGLPQYPASLALKRRLAESWPAEPEIRVRRWTRWKPWLAPAFATCVLLAVLAPLTYHTITGGRAESERMVHEAANDYVRLLSSQHPLDIESGGIHQVKPWFEGRLDFAPVVHFDGDQEFPLKGGSVGYFLDRRAAVFVYARRLHTIALFVFRADGLPWVTRDLVPMGAARAHVASMNGFNVILWRQGELGYALVSDVDLQDLRDLAAKIAG